MNAELYSARLLTGVLAAGLVLTGCAAADTSGPATPSTSAPSSAQGEQNEADVEFVQAMLPHHRQAVEMAALAAGRTGDPRVLDLATRIGSGQQPEIDLMTDWLQEWGAEVPTVGDGMGGMSGMDHGSGAGGMMTPDQMLQLQGVSGPEFDRMFLEMMTEHHRGAVEMAEAELGTGADPEALALAQTIIDTQQAEISEMDELSQQV